MKWAALIALVILVSLARAEEVKTPPLSFIAIDCTQYGSTFDPVLILSHLGVGAVGPLWALYSSPEAVGLLDQIRKGKHEKWVDPACGSGY